MSTRISAAFAILAALAATALACKKDPTADGVGTPTAVVADFAAATVTITDTVVKNDTTKFLAWVVDERFTPLEEPITIATATCSPALPADTGAVNASKDATYSIVPPTRIRVQVIGTKVGRRCVVLSSGGAKTATVKITVN